MSPAVPRLPPVHREDPGPAWIMVWTMFNVELADVSPWLTVLVFSTGAVLGTVAYQRLLPRLPDAVMAALVTVFTCLPCALVLYGFTARNLQYYGLWATVLAGVVALVWWSVRASVVRPSGSPPPER